MKSIFSAVVLGSMTHRVLTTYTHQHGRTAQGNLSHTPGGKHSIGLGMAPLLARSRIWPKSAVPLR